MNKYAEAKYITQDPEVVKDLAQRSGQILLALLEEMRIIKANYPVAQFLYDEGATFIKSVLDGTHPLPSKAFIRHRYSDDWDAIQPYPLLVDALDIFSIAIHSAQPDYWSDLVTQLEADFARREIGTGRVRV
jgi:hypothetical protein